MKDGFNADFYVAIATVIPVLLLAVNVTSFRYGEFAGTIRKLIRPGGSTRIFRVILAVLVFVAPFFLGVWAEISALLALQSRENATAFLNKLFIFAALLLFTAALPGTMDDIVDDIVENNEDDGSKKRRLTRKSSR